ncbi:hypothetical protein QQF64_005073 [Cirrhinus molitorella]|uniref:Secreted protein n=1 Tax=Cirrhinus molitorella TaxID=172907 RepID=A0ABR3MI47_9TELE
MPSSWWVLRWWPSHCLSPSLQLSSSQSLCQVPVHPESMRQDFVAFTDHPRVFKRRFAITAFHKGTRGLLFVLELQDMISLR